MLFYATTTDPSQWNRKPTKTTRRRRPILNTVRRRQNSPVGEQQPSIRRPSILNFKLRFNTEERSVSEFPFDLEKFA